MDIPEALKTIAAVLEKYPSPPVFILAPANLIEQLPIWIKARCICIALEGGAQTGANELIIDSFGPVRIADLPGYK